jgi:chemotaxis signal transduction protein
MSDEKEGNDEQSVISQADNQFVTFVVANELFAAPMAPVQEIIHLVLEPCWD